LGKTSFELVPDVEVNLVFNFHSIWSIIAPESSFGRNEHIWEEKSAPETSNRTLCKNPGQCPTKIFSLMFIHDFGQPYRTLRENPG
jgi:hypothetical protein